MQHDFLWRTSRRLPERGRIGIFNRSYYEEVLAVRVHPEILLNEALSKERNDDKSFWEDRYRSIVAQERHLHHNSMRIVKIFLHLSKDEQCNWFISRIDDPDKNWKFIMTYRHERGFWDQYVQAYEHCLAGTSTHHAPWFIVPRGRQGKRQADCLADVLDALSDLEMSYPKTTAGRHDELESIRKLLVGESQAARSKS